MLDEQQIIGKIIEDLENDIGEKPVLEQRAEETMMDIVLPEFTLDFNTMKSRIYDMNNEDFWLQKALQKDQKSSIEAAIDYYKQGLRLVSISFGSYFAFIEPYQRQVAV